MSLLFGVALLALAVVLGGLAAIWRDTGRRAMHGIRTFAVVAAGAVAVLHLLPEAMSEIGWPALVRASSAAVNVIHAGIRECSVSTSASAAASSTSGIVSTARRSGAADTSTSRRSAWKSTSSP